MEDLEKHAELCELLKIWYYIKKERLVWGDVVEKLEERINLLAKDRSK